jgi:TetR/AcrR family transcriptional regulator, transcriptional repressor for nem operon
LRRSIYVQEHKKAAMPYTPEHKAKTRAKIIESARFLFSQHGFELVSIDQVMEHAGLTRGGFYNHFGSKDDLYVEAVKSFATCNPLVSELAKLPRRPDDGELARMLVTLYLSDAVLKDPGMQCPLYALPADVARAGLKPQKAYTRIVENMLHVFERAFPASDARAREKAEIILNLCVGGMVVARTTSDPALSSCLRKAARTQALSLLEPSRKRAALPSKYARSGALAVRSAASAKASAASRKRPARSSK